MIDSTIICALIAAAVTLITSIGTWHFSVKKDRDKAKGELRKALDDNLDKTQKEIEALKDDIAGVTATIQNQVGIIELKIVTLTEQVEKHNSVIDRTYKLEQGVAVLDEKIKVANHRLDDLEHGAN